MIDRCPLVGVFVDVQLSGGAELSSRIKADLTGLLKQTNLRSTQWWPVHRWQIAEGEFWKDLGRYREQVIESVRWFWENCASVVDAGIDPR